ncbi:MAG: fibronectin type III domain-containing protein [Candidatus Poribacteria bacterium]|nr:fibronectin type III domain-containing protein [Candidatus Poribacteria bacterium]
MNIKRTCRRQLLKPFAAIGLILPLLAFVNGCGGDNPTTAEETVQISDVTVSVEGDQASIQWKTDVPADSLVDYGVTTNYGQSATESALKTEHAMTLTALQLQTTYSFQVTSTDESGGEAKSSNFTFATLAAGEKGPQPSKVEAVAKDDSVTITWKANETATGEIEYGESTAYGSVAQSGKARIAHSVQLTGLKPETTYHYRIKVTDLDREVFTSSDLTFQTEAKEAEPEERISRINVTARQWEFQPAEIQVTEGDKVILTIRSVDVVHGFGLAAFRIDNPLNPGKEVVIEFKAEKKGRYPFICTINCGAGHANMNGTLIVEGK